MLQTKHPALAATRDKLLALQGHHDKAVDEFVWPDVGDRFNWAVDWFDAFARGNDAPALVIVEEDGSRRRRYSFAALVAPLRPGRGVAHAAGGPAGATPSSSCSATRSSCGRRCSPSSSSAR